MDELRRPSTGLFYPDLPDLAFYLHFTKSYSFLYYPPYKFQAPADTGSFHRSSVPV